MQVIAHLRRDTAVLPMPRTLRLLADLQRLAAGRVDERVGRVGFRHAALAADEVLGFVHEGAACGGGVVGRGGAAEVALGTYLGFGVFPAREVLVGALVGRGRGRVRAGGCVLAGCGMLGGGGEAGDVLGFVDEGGHDDVYLVRRTVSLCVVVVGGVLDVVLMGIR